MLHNPDNRYELVDGKLELMNPPTFRHILICDFIRDFLQAEIKRLQLPWLAIREGGVRTGWRKSRIADVYVIDKEQIMNSLDESGVLETSPLLIVEVVSPDSVKRDYRYKRCSTVFARGNAGVSPAYSTLAAGVSPMSDCIKKRSEYAALGINEYWIVDSASQQISVLLLDEGLYEETVFKENQKLVFSIFQEIKLTPKQIFSTAENI